MSFKQFLLEDTTKLALQKAKGLTHISFDNYKDRSGNRWFWDKFEGKFRKLSLPKEQQYKDFFDNFILNEKKLEPLIKVMRKISRYVNEETHVKFDPQEVKLLKEIEDLTVEVEKLRGKSIYRGMGLAKPFNKELNKEFLYKPRKEYSSWSYSFKKGNDFYENSLEEHGVVLEGKLENQKTINVVIFEKFFDKLTSYLYNGDSETIDDNKIVLKFMENVFDSQMKGEAEVIVFGSLKAKAIKKA